MPATIEVWKCLFHYSFFRILTEAMLKESFQITCFKDMWREPDKLIHPFQATFYTPENIREPQVFWCFQGEKREVSSMK